MVQADKPESRSTPLMDTKQVAKYLGLSVRTIRRLNSLEAIPKPILTDSKKHYWSRFHLRDWLRKTNESNQATP